MIYPEKHKSLKNICEKYNVKRLRLFGSTISGTPRADSDIDILVEFPDNEVPGLFKLGKIQQELSELFTRPVDLKTPGFFSKKELGIISKSAQVEYEAA